MEYTTPTFDVNLDPTGFVVDLDGLYASLAQLHDKRHARGVRYALVTALIYIVLAKLAGEDRVYGIADWVKYRQKALAEALHLVKVRAPSANTLSRILGTGMNVEEFEQVVHDFFAAKPEAGTSVVIVLDGKTLRGTIRAGHSRGRHLLAAYMPAEGWVVMQVEVEGKENEITAAPRVLQCLDLRDKVVTGDAMLAQRELSVQIVEAGGDYVWTVKGNQSRLQQDIAVLFEPERTTKGFGQGSYDFRSASTNEKGHGRLERRSITVSQELQGYLDWPYARQVFRLERHFTRLADGKVNHEVVYGVTSLSAQQADAPRLLQLARSHWGIENGLHYRRDETLREDWCHLRIGDAPRAMAIINNLVLGLLLRQGHTNIPRARRYYDAHPVDALRLVLFSTA